jgi:hypothetical protein
MVCNKCNVVVGAILTPTIVLSKIRRFVAAHNTGNE